MTQSKDRWHFSLLKMSHLCHVNELEGISSLLKREYIWLPLFAGYTLRCSVDLHAPLHSWNSHITYLSSEQENKGCETSAIMAIDGYSTKSHWRCTMCFSTYNSHSCDDPTEQLLFPPILFLCLHNQVCLQYCRLTTHSTESLRLKSTKWVPICAVFRRAHSNRKQTLAHQILTLHLI